MNTTCCEADDILVMHMSDKPIAREVSQDWHTHLSCAQDGSTVEVLLDAKAQGAYLLEMAPVQAAA